METINDVDTQELEEVNLNTDTDEVSDEEQQAPDDTEVEDGERLSQDDLDNLDDDAFMELFSSGRLDKPITEAKGEVKEDLPAPVPNTPVEAQNGVPTNVDYKSAYESIFKTFKANGKEITPKTTDDVVSLMQMGANYTKKSQALSSLKKTAESLSKAEIDENSLNFLIDLHKGDKEAIKKLLEKHKVDPIELDMENTNYVPKNNIVSDDDVEYSILADEIRESLPKIKEILAYSWDKKSKELLFKDPEVMRGLHEEIQMGRFDSIQKELEVEKTFGRYKGVSDIQAYIDLVSKKTQQQVTNPVVQQPVTKPVTTISKPIPDKTKAAPTRAKQGTKSTLTPADMFNMSDEDFNRLSERDLV